MQYCFHKNVIRDLLIALFFMQYHDITTRHNNRTSLYQYIVAGLLPTTPTHI